MTWTTPVINEIQHRHGSDELSFCLDFLMGSVTLLKNLMIGARRAAFLALDQAGGGLPQPALSPCPVCKLA